MTAMSYDATMFNVGFIPLFSRSIVNANVLTQY
jgi:hypothetical protein